MLIPREKKILKLLLSEEKKFTVAEIAEKLQVSQRTVKSDIKNINEEIHLYSCSIETKRRVGVWIVYNPEGKKQLESILNKTQEMDIPAGTRRYYIASKLLNCDGYISMESFANQFYVSKATILSDVNELDDFWKDTKVIITRKVRYGIKVEGSESDIRYALFYAQKKILEQSPEKPVYKLQILYPEVDLQRLLQLIHEAERQFEFVLTDTSVNEFLIQIAIILQRETKNCRIEMLQKSTGYNKNKKEWFVCQFLREQIILNMNCEMPEIEMQEVLRSLRGLRYQVPILNADGRTSTEIKSEEMYEYMINVLKEVDEKYALQFSEDDDLLFFLFNHLKSMVQRIQSKMFLEDMTLESVKNEMSYEYEIAAYIIERFSKRYEIEVREDEITYVTFHIAASMERILQTNEKKYRVTIVCMAGIGTSQFISVKLKRIFPNIIVKQVVSEEMAKKLKKEEQDFVITTVPLAIDNIDVLKVSPILNDQDIKKIQKYVRFVDEREEHEGENYYYLKKYLHSDIAIFNCDLKSKEEAISLLSNRMIQEGYADAEYTESIFQRERISDTYMSTMIAMPHAFIGHTLKQGIGILTLRNPVNWGQGQVRIVIMLGLDMKMENEEIQRIFKAIYRLTRNPKDVERMLKIETFESLLKNLI